jgi:DNA-binding response OmpR family regulator
MARVLVVDDVKFISRMLAEIFTKEGHEVASAGNGREALDHVAETLPDLVVLDVAMPEMDGLEVVRHLREDERSRDVPVLMVTARTDEKTRSAAAEAGVDDFLVKPFEAPALLRRARKLLETGRGAPPAEGQARSAASGPVPSGRRALGPGLEVEEHPTALVVRLASEEPGDDVVERLEPEIRRSGRGVLVDWRAPADPPGSLVEALGALADRLAGERRVLRVANAPEPVARAFARAGREALLLRPR